ncbi:hypothetical protein AVEN_156326-1 [Araneus ventricosus]|uniref:Uncharacterized protein n=1 Tax=Araneus ventricosus TaxID=182803 RepID=A0A4Y2L6E3_ARAVE|nr:hypothetical protein AVEN_156326-1 [Araneus ventricosus]
MKDPCDIVCELNFDPADVRRQSEYYDSNAGKLLTAVLSQSRLTDDAVPSVFPECPAYLSRSNKMGREAPDKKIQRKESLEIVKALQLSVDTFKEYEEKISFGNLEQLTIKIKGLQLPDVSTIVKNEYSIMFF